MGTSPVSGLNARPGLYLTVLLVLTPILVTFTNMPEAAGSSQPTILLLKTWGGSLDEGATAVTLDSSDNIYVTGYTYSFGPFSPSCYSIFVLKYSPLGTLLMQKLWYNGSSASPTAIAVDSSGNIYLTGFIHAKCLGGLVNPFLIKLDSAGNFQWQKFYQLANSYLDGLATDSSGNIYATGVINYHSSPDALLVKFAPNGTLLWQRTWGGSSIDVGSAIAVDSSGNLYVAGSTRSFGPPTANAVLLKLDSSGNWKQNIIIGNGSEFGYGVALDNTGSIYVSGGTNYHGSRDVLLAKFDSTGAPIWQKSWGGSNGTEFPYALSLDSSGNPVIAGYTTSYGAGGPGFQAAFLVQMDSSGSGVLSSLVLGKYNRNIGAQGVVCDSFDICSVVGYLIGTPPYFTVHGNSTLGNPFEPLSSVGNSTLGTPNIQVAPIPNSGSSSLSGNQTYAGSNDAMLFKYGLPPEIILATNPVSGGFITFNGTSYSEGQNISITLYTLGNATVAAKPSVGYYFMGWASTGGVLVLNPASSHTIVSVAGAGTLRTNFALGTPTTTISILIESLIVAPAILIRRVKKNTQRSKRPRQPASNRSPFLG